MVGKVLGCIGIGLGISFVLAILFSKIEVAIEGSGPHGMGALASLVMYVMFMVPGTGIAGLVFPLVASDKRWGTLIMKIGGTAVIIGIVLAIAMNVILPRVINR
jgi:hypothetical protein